MADDDAPKVDPRDLLSEEELAEYTEVFTFYDQDGGGSISTNELGTALRALGYTPTDAEVVKMIDDVDENGDGDLDFHEFLNLMLIMKQNDPLEELINAFKVFDRDGSGTIAARELMHILCGMGNAIPRSEAEEWLLEVEIDNNGEIDIEAFLDQKFAFLKKY